MSKITIRQGIIKYHKYLGLLAAIPAMLWALSGMMHPFMANWFKTKLAAEFYKADKVAIDTNMIAPFEAAQSSAYKEITSIRPLSFAGKTFYVIENGEESTYIDAKENTIHENASAEYAEIIARSMTGDSISKVEISILKDFDQEYPYVNRILPVYKVAFDRPDRMDIYVEPDQSRFVGFVDFKRRVFIKIFDVLHNFSWLEWIGNHRARIVVMVFFLSMIFLSAISGIVLYVIMWKSFSKRVSVPTFRWRKYHRTIGIFASLVSLTFSFSGAYHATRKWNDDERIKYKYDQQIQISEIKEASLPPQNFQKTNLIKVDDSLYWQTLTTDFKTKVSKLSYINAHSGLEDNNASKFATKLVESFNQDKKLLTNSHQLDSTEVLTAFISEYGFVNKRLPVVQMVYDGPTKPAFYVEVFTSRISTVVKQSDRYEGLSFAFLHKYHGLGKFGKNFRDAFTVFCGLGVFMVSFFGFLLLFKQKAN